MVELEFTYCRSVHWYLVLGHFCCHCSRDDHEVRQEQIEVEIADGPGTLRSIGLINYHHHNTGYFYLWDHY